MDADGSNQINLTNNSEVDSMPSWSPDGSKITFYSERGSWPEPWQIYVMDADGSNQTNITDQFCAGCSNPGEKAWGPDWYPVGP